MKPLKPMSPTLADGTNVGELDVSWTAPHSRGAAITGYDVQYRASSSGTWTEWVHTGTGTTTTVTGLQEHLSSSGITYLVRVRATNSQGDSEWSDLAYWPKAIAPLAPSTLTATSGNAAATLRWTSGGDGGAAITRWEMQRAEKQAGSNSYGAYGNWTSIDNSDATTTSTTIYGLTVGSTYKFKLRAVNSVGNGAASAESNAVIPSSATLTASDVTHSSVTLTIGNYSESWYYKHTAPDGGNCWFSVVSGGGVVLSGLAGNTNYTFKAYRDSGCTTELAATSATFLTKPGKPTQPTMTAGPGSGEVTLASTLSGGSGALTRWEYTKDGGTTWVTVNDTDNTLSHVVSGLTDGISYTFNVRAVNSAGTGPASDAYNTPTAPEAVASVTANHQGSSLDVTWPAAARADNYHVTYTDSNAVSWQLGAFDHTGTSLTINGVDSTKTYIVGVRARNTGGWSGWTNSATATFTAPDPVASVTVVHQGSSLDVTWPAAARADSYHVTYTGDNGVSWQLGAFEHVGTSLTINGVDSTKTYIVGVRAKNAAGGSGWTNSATATLVAPPDPVASVTVVHKGSSLDVTWPAAARADSYHVTYTGDNATSWQLGAFEHVGTSLTINGVDSTKTYIVGVRAKNAGGSSGWVNSAPAAPPAFSVADATVGEPGTGGGTSATLDFVVTLSRSPSVGTSEAVSVDYATSDGTATAGADYTAASGTLSFSAGETSKTVTVTVLNDAHDEGSETMTLTLSNATGAVIGDGEATGTITNAGPMPQAWISRFGRTVADQVVEAVASRLRSKPTPGLEVTLAGERLGWSADADAGQPVAQQAVEQLAQWLVVGNGESGDVAVRTIEGRELVANSSFAFASRKPGEGLFSFWGRGAVTNFDGREGELALDGEVTTWLLGTDWSWGQGTGGGEVRRSTAGLLLSRSRADGGYDSPAGGPSGDVDATLTGVFPWGSHRFTDRLAVWGVAGYGQGELEVTPKLSTGEDDATLTADLNLWLAAAGLRGTLLDGGNDGLTITGTTDAMVVGTTSERVTGLEAAQATVTRLRLGVEAQRPIPLGNPDSGAEEGSGAVLTPSLEMGLRHDGGDAETGFGLDLGGGIVLSHPQRGLEVEVRGRGLLTHAAEGFRDRGFSGSLSWQQWPDSELGAALSLSQTMGGSSSGGADALLSRVTLEGLAANDGDDELKNQRLEFKVSYGFLAFGDRFTLTPELGLGLYDSGRDYRIGWRLTHLAETGAFDLSFDVTRRERINNDGTAPDHGVQLEVNTRF